MTELHPSEAEDGVTGLRPVYEAEFADRVLGAEVPVILVFTATWCAPCKWLTPYLDGIVRETLGGVLIHVVDTDRSPEIARSYAVASVPTCIFMREGREVERSLGVEPERLRAWAAPFLAGAGGPPGL